MSPTSTLVASDDEDFFNPYGNTRDTKSLVSARHVSLNNIKEPLPVKTKQVRKGGINPPRNSIYRASKEDEHDSLTALPLWSHSNEMQAEDERAKKSRSWTKSFGRMREIRTSSWTSSNLALSIPWPSTQSRKHDSPVETAPPCYRQFSEKLSTTQQRLSDPFEIPPISTNFTTTDSTEKQAKKSSPWNRLIEEYRKNYCPRNSPPLVLPTVPTDIEKYSYIDMNRPFLIGCSLIAFLALAFGAWMFARTSYIFSWYALYVFFSEFCLFSSLFISILGRKFDVSSHERLLKEFPLSKSDDAPTVDIYLPVCREPIEILANTWKYVAALQYPASRISIYVLDDGASDSVRSLSQQYFNFTYLRRPNRPELRKAGNLRHAYSQTSAEFFVVFDADFCPRPDFLLNTIPYLLDDPRRAILQTPQFFRDTARDQTWTEQGAGAVQEYMFRIMQPCRDRWGAAICVGSNAVYRRLALKSVGGTVPVDCSEDIHTGVYVATHGWTVKNIPLVLACGMSPDTPATFFSQQLRWCAGSIPILFRRREFWKSSFTLPQKFCYVIGFVYYFALATQPFLAPLPAPLILWTRPHLFKYYSLFFAFPSLLLSLVGLRIWARGRYTLSVQYVQIIMSFAFLQATIDYIKGAKLAWIPSGGGGKAHRKNNRYRNMRMLAWVWTLMQNGALVAAGAYRVVRGDLKWVNLLPAVVINGFNLLCMHRFLLYRHPRD